ncbi:lysosomal acid glucosylceramidase-like [Achroia grisella]|uniref:lysosomal acid glucosylceramidase-like n=1 Tax=Achroia grisella TaxID=688607 RepID=UPI0027D229A1|nr:lysosomal acid glucosylceramidase-like [Achroia grisella]
MIYFKFCTFISVLLIFWANGVYSDKTCAARQIEGQSVVCVCNTTYCDEITRARPDGDGAYIAYTSSKEGSRFKKIFGELESYENDDIFKTVLTLDPNKKYQFIEGFGGAVTDSTALNWKNLSDPQLMQYLIDSYFSSTGLEYNVVRLPIGGTDFSTHAYAYNDEPEDDVNLTHFNLTSEDYDLKLPMLKAIFEASSTSVHVLATTWSPPVWMKSNHAFSGKSHLLPEYYSTYALYHLKFIEMYTALGVPIWGITTTNEPVNGDLGVTKINCLGWSAEDMGQWIANDLGPLIRNSTFKDIKILSVDDQRPLVLYFFNLMVQEHPECLKYIDGVAVHFYIDTITPPAVFNTITKNYPDKFIMATEGCKGSLFFEKKVQLGAWDRAVAYFTDILEDLNYNLVGWIDWNMCLNDKGGPTYVGNYVDSPIIVFPENGEFVKQPTFYAMGHFSKFIPRGSLRIDVEQSKPLLSKSVDNVALVTPDDTTVVVLYNSESSERKVKIRLNDQQATLTLEADSITTIEINA